MRTASQPRRLQEEWRRVPMMKAAFGHRGAPIARPDHATAAGGRNQHQGLAFRRPLG